MALHVIDDTMESTTAADPATNPADISKLLTHFMAALATPLTTP